MAALSGCDWTAMLQRARPVALLGKLAVKAQDAGVWDALPAAAQRQLGSMARFSDYNGRHMLAEAFYVTQGLQHLDVPLVFLKGAAYALAVPSVARGRLSSDIDIMVPRDALDDVEAALMAIGWRRMAMDVYDQRYYRQWMHELPPLQHQNRATVADIHHTILPLTARITPDADALFAGAQPVDVGRQSALVLCPEDMLIHVAIHAFYDGELNARLRDVLDVHEMVTAFASEAGFWGRLVARAALHQAGRPLFYALYFARQFFGTSLPDGFLEDLPHRPGTLALATMRRLVPLSLVPSAPDWEETPPITTRLARFLLFVRSHWLRMPPLLLARHLSIKAWRGVRGGLRRGSLDKA